MNKKFVTGLSALACCVGAHAHTFQVPDTVGYKDVSIIKPSILSECTGLGRTVADSLTAEMGSLGLQVQRVNEFDPKQGPIVDIKISNAVSSGNAFIGHSKSVMVWVDLRVGDRSVAARGFNRDTMGGAFAGFKGSCAVLDRAATVVGKDVAKWLRTLSVTPAAAAPTPLEPASEATAAQS